MHRQLCSQVRTFRATQNHDSRFGTCDSQDNEFNQKKTGLQPVSKPVERILGFFRKVLMQKCVKNFLKGKLPTCSELFLLCSFLGDFFVGGGDAKVDSRPVFHR